MFKIFFRILAVPLVLCLTVDPSLAATLYQQQSILRPLLDIEHFSFSEQALAEHVLFERLPPKVLGVPQHQHGDIWWSKRALLERFENPPFGVTNPEDSRQWQSAGYRDLVRHVIHQWRGGWDEFVIAANKGNAIQESHLFDKPITAPRKWSAKRIDEIWSDPPKEITDITNSTEWEKAGYRGFINAATKLSGGSWVQFVALKQRRAAHRANVIYTPEKIVELWTHPPEEVRDRRNYAQWDAAGYGEFVAKVSRQAGGWHEFVKSQNEVPLARHKEVWKATHTDWTKIADIAPDLVRPFESGRTPRYLTLIEEVSLAGEVLKKNQAAHDTLIAAHLHWVDVLLQDFLRKRPDLLSFREDLRQAAIMGDHAGAGGLYRAVGLFDPNKKARLTSFSKKYIIGAMKDKATKISRQLRQEAPLLERLQRQENNTERFFSDAGPELLRMIGQRLSRLGIAGRNRDIFARLMKGEKAETIAEYYELSQGLVSQIKRRLLELLINQRHSFYKTAAAGAA